MHVASKHLGFRASRKAAKGVWFILAVLLLVVWVPTLSYIAWRDWRDNKADVLPRVDLRSGKDFTYDAARARPDQAVWFTYPIGGERVRLVLQKDRFGTIRTVVGSCTACYAYKSEHKFKNGQFICGRCRHAMRLGDPNEKLTPAKGCVAVPVAFETDNRVLRVRASNIEEHLRQLEAMSAPIP